MVTPVNCEDDRACKKQPDFSRPEVGWPPTPASDEIDDVGTSMRVLLAERALSGAMGEEGIGGGRSYRGKDGSWKGAPVSEMGSAKSNAEVLVASPYSGEDWEKPCRGTSSTVACLFSLMYMIKGSADAYHWSKCQH
jgi:hypothetical protein